MKIEVDIKRADQSWDLDTGIQQNYLVLDVFGVEVRAPCSEEQLVAVLQAVTTPEEGEEEVATDETQQRAAPTTFQGQTHEEEPLPPPPSPKLQAAPQRQLKPMKRGDDVGIAQG